MGRPFSSIRRGQKNVLGAMLASSARAVFLVSPVCVSDSFRLSWDGVRGYRLIQLSCAQGSSATTSSEDPEEWLVRLPTGGGLSKPVSPKPAGLPIPQMIRPDTDAHLRRTASS